MSKIETTCPACDFNMVMEVPLAESATVECYECGEHISAHLRIHRISDDAPYRNEEWLREEYEVKERSMASIAEECAVSPMTICGWLGKHGIETRRRGARKQS